MVFDGEHCFGDGIIGGIMFKSNTLNADTKKRAKDFARFYIR